jgi:integrase/recombinase XerD
LLINQGKGSKDRYVPIGVRAIAWLEKYIREGRPQLVSEPDDFTVFLTAQGEPFSRDHLTFVVKGRIDAAKLGKSGACHLFRHTMATLMHEGGADIRHIGDPRPRGHQDDADLHAGRYPCLAADPRGHASGRGARCAFSGGAIRSRA